MIRRCFPSRFTFAFAVLVVTLAACGPQKTQAPVLAPTPPQPVAPGPAIPIRTVNLAQDEVLTLIANSDEHFKAGEQALAQGHIEAAKQEFDRAIDMLLESPYGGRTEPRIREHYDRLVNRITAYEVKEIVEGDGVTEKRYEPASIDALLSLSATFPSPPLTAELKDVVQADLSTTIHDISIPLNARVLSYIELFQGRLHDFIEDGMKRGSKYLPMIQDVFRAEGLPLDLAYVPLIESAFNPNALSRAKAKGVWQFMAGTAVENGLRRDWYIDERSDPEKATVAAARYLKTLGGLFEGDWHLALASYNGGPGRLQRAIKRSGADDFWTLAGKPRILPRETREYVPMILAAIVIARNPSRYGFEFETEEPTPYDEITLVRPVDLRRVAEWAETTIDVIQTLNPELRRWTTPIRDEEYDLKVPAGTGDQIKARLQEAPPVDLVSLKWYTVKRGETMQIVARKLGVRRADLAEANYLSLTARLSTGQKLIVPREAPKLTSVRTDQAIPDAESQPIQSEAVPVADSVEGPDRVKVVYRVRQGDTLASIAKLFKTTVASLKTWNRIPGSYIAAGDRLIVYARAADRDLS
jgi:peptidoglycan lytic transglycosylase D